MATHAGFNGILVATGSRRKAMHFALNVIEASGLNLSASRDALRKKLAVVSAGLEEGETIEMSLADRRPENPGRPRTTTTDERRTKARERDRKRRGKNPEINRKKIAKWRSARRREELELSLLNLTQQLKDKK